MLPFMQSIFDFDFVIFNLFGREASGLFLRSRDLTFLK
jgi:hypothetical protein